MPGNKTSPGINQLIFNMKSYLRSNGIIRLFSDTAPVIPAL